MKTTTSRRPKKLKRKNSAAMPILVAALVTGGIATYVAVRPERVQSIALKPEVQLTSEDDMVLLPTPTRAIAKGERLSDVPFTPLKWPKSRMTEEYVTDLAVHRESIALAALPKALPIPASAVSKDALDANAVVEGIPDGMRAITVRVDAESAVEGWARSGNFVDVILIRAASGKEGSPLEAKVIAENVRILSAGQSVQPSRPGVSSAPDAPKTITLLVTQEDALRIKAATNLGKLTFSLRGQKDLNPTMATTIDQKSLLGGAKSSKEAPQTERFKGYARDAEGKLFVLGENNQRWVRAAQMPAELVGASKQ